MRRMIALASALLVACTAVASAEQPLVSPNGVIVVAQTSCQSFFNQCAARCANNPKGESKAKCTSDHCSPKLASCRRSGCWTEGAAFGGGTTCSLAK